MKNELSAIDTMSIKVALRIRPNSDQDRDASGFVQKSDDQCLLTTQNTVRIVSNNKLITFDHVFGPTTPQYKVFSTIGQDLVSKFVEGNNVNVIAFGQASSGKTFTLGMAQPTGKSKDGIIPRAMMKLFQVLQQQPYNNTPLFTKSSPTTCAVTPSTTVTPVHSKSTGTAVHTSALKYKVKVSFIKILNEQVIDLLNDDPATVRKNTKGQIHWTDIKQMNIDSIDDALWYLEKGTTSSAIGTNRNNKRSTASHTIFSVVLQQDQWVPSHPSSQSQYQHRPSSYQNLGQPYHGHWISTTSKLNFIDLADDIPSSQTDSEGYQQNKGANIKKVMAVLSDTSNYETHLSSRYSTLESLLQDLLAGNAMTWVIACASSQKQDLPETLNTLQYAVCARNIKNPSSANGPGTWKTKRSLDTDISQPNAISFPTVDETSKCDMPSASPSSESSYYSKPTIGRPNDSQQWQDQQSMIMDLQQQIKKLDKKANASEEHNKRVAMELQHFKNLYQRSSGSQQLDLRFMYWVEPVVEEYEKYLANLEVENSVLKAAVNYSDTMMDELQSKCDSLQLLVNQQQDMLAGVKDKIQYIRHRQGFDGLRNKMELLTDNREQTLTHTKEQIRDDPQQPSCSTTYRPESLNTLQRDGIATNIQQQGKNATAKDWYQQGQPILHELNKLDEKYKHLEADRNRWKAQAERHHELDYNRPLDRLTKLRTIDGTGSSQFIRSYNNYYVDGEQTTTNITTPGDNKQVNASCTTLKTNRMDHQAYDVSLAKNQAEKLGDKYTQSINELDDVLQRYVELLDYAEQLEHISVMDTTQPSTSLDSVTDNVSLLLSVTCNPDASTLESRTETILPIADDRTSEWSVLSSPTGDF